MWKERRKRLLGAMGLVALLATCVWAAEEVSVQGKEIYVLKGKGSLYLPPLATAHRGDTLTVIGHEGRWLHVQFGDKEGYVLESALKGEQSSGGAGSGGSGGGSTEATAAAAARGWNSNEFAKSHSLNTDGLNAMFATRDRIAADPAGFDQFKADGHVGAQ